MGRKAIVIEKADLDAALKLAESTKSWPNHNQLFKHLSEQFNCAPIIIRNRIIDFGLEVTTQKGKKGRSTGDGAGFLGPRKRKGKANDFKQALTMVFLQDGMQKRVESACKGSLKSAVALKCFDCANFSKKEVGLCTIVQCPLWGYRPWVNKQSLTEEGRNQIRVNANKPEEGANVE